MMPTFIKINLFSLENPELEYSRAIFYSGNITNPLLDSSINHSHILSEKNCSLWVFMTKSKTEHLNARKYLGLDSDIREILGLEWMPLTDEEKGQKRGKHGQCLIHTKCFIALHPAVSTPWVPLRWAPHTPLRC